MLLSVLNYQTAVVRKDFDTANAILPSIPRSEHASVARFLESQGFKEEALAVSTDPDHRFELAVDLRKMDVAHQVPFFRRRRSPPSSCPPLGLSRPCIVPLDNIAEPSLPHHAHYPQ